MRVGKVIGMTQRYLLPALVLLCIATFIISCSLRQRTEFPELRPIDGILDVRDVDFEADVYHLVNQWDYYPGQLYAPDAFFDPDTAPVKNNESPLDVGLGTWRLRILAQPDIYLSLCSFSIDYSTRVFVNGKEVRNIGFVSDNPDETVHKVRYMTLPLYSGESGEIEIVYQYANYMHNDGGFIQNTQISTPENIDEYQRGLTLWALVMSGGLMFLMFYFLICASFQKNAEYAVLALCCLVIAFRNQFFFSEHLQRPGYNFILGYRLVILDVSCIPAAVLYLMAAFYQRAEGRRSVIALTAVFTVLSALHFTLDTRDLVALCHVCYYVSTPFLIWFIVRLVRYFMYEHRPDRLDALTLGALAYFTVTLIWEGTSSGSNSLVNHFGLTPLALVICILVLAIVINARIERKMYMLREAEQRNEILDQVNTMNKDFLRMVAHELKTPLTVISGYAQLMGRQIEKGHLSPQAAERLGTIRNEADRLSEIVNRLMDYTIGESKETELKAVDVETLLESSAAIMKPVCAKRGNTLTIRNDCRCRLHGNQELLMQVLINLIANASRHTSKGVITLEVEEVEGFAAFSISDTGCGIASDVIPHIFEKGFTTTEGRGLGLAICRETIQLHGGTIELVSTGETGSRFRFTVPKENRS